MSTQPFTSKLFRLSGLALLTLGLVSCQEKKSEIPPIPPITTPRYFCGQDAQGTYTTYLRRNCPRKKTSHHPLVLPGN